MPTRILREGILTSEKVNSLSADAELFYRRLMSVADDYGRFYSHLGLLRAACYPLQIDSHPESTCKALLSECTAMGLVIIYGEKYLQIINFNQQTRSKSKFPEPSKSAIDVQLLSNAVQLRSESESESDAKADTGKREPSDGNIPTWEDVLGECSMRNIAEASARSFFNHYEGKNLWLNQHGRLINWRHVLLNWSVTDAAKPKTGQNGHQTPNGAQTVILGKEYDRIVEEMRTLKATYGDHQTWVKSDIDRWAKLKARKLELKPILGITV